MPRDETALVMVLPEDGADVVLRKLRSAGARSVQLLVAEGAVALRRPEVAARINDLAIAEGIEVTLISSDGPTVEAARAGGIQTLRVDESRVLAPRRSARTDRPATPYSTRVIERPAAPAFPDELDAPPRPAAAPAPAPAVFPDELDAPPRPPAARRPAPAALSDEQLLAASFGLDAPAAPRPAPAAPAAPVPAAPAAPVPAAPRPAPAQAPGPAPTTRAPRAAAPAPAARPLPEAPPRRRGWPIAAALALLALLLAAGGLWLWTSRVTVAVAAPVRSDDVTPFTALPVPIAPAGAASASAVVAEPLSAEASVTEGGEVTEGTLTPSGTASGVVNILNSSAQSILLPAGTEFVAVKGDGQEVPFVSGGEVLVPGATTADQGAQIVTTRGQAQVPVSARSPGSGSNVEANTVRRITPPGGPTFSANAGSLIVTNPPIEGGSEQEVRIVKDSDVQKLFAPALEALDAQARAQLDAQARERGFTVDPSTIAPRRAELEQLQGFDYTVDPPVGATLDNANPRFTLTVRAAYTALAAPPDRPVSAQLGAAVTEQLRQSGEIKPGDCRAPAVTAWRWDGQGLVVDGEVQPDRQSPRCQGGLDAAALAQVRDAVRGKSRAEADAALQALVDQGVIGSYTLPDRAGMPAFDWLITVRGA
jgi:hypothetical protein